MVSECRASGCTCQRSCQKLTSYCSPVVLVFKVLVGICKGYGLVSWRTGSIVPYILPAFTGQEISGQCIVGTDVGVYPSDLEGVTIITAQK